MKIVITGGHHTAALILAKELIKRGHQVFWFGHKYSMWGDKKPCAEYLEVRKAKIPFFELKAGKYWKTLNPQKLIHLPLGFLQTFYLLKKIKPDLIFSFGGYLAVPTVIVGFFLKIPSVTHEQTTVAGFANKIIAPFVKKIFISWKESKKYFPSQKTILTGLPLRKEIFEEKTKKYRFKEDLPTILIIGGKQGSHIINQAVFAILDKLLEKYNIIHQCGFSSLYNDFQKAKEKRKKMKKQKRERYKPEDYIFPKDIGSAFAQADLVVSRAGAHTIYELLALKKPCLLIPYPFLYKDEQTQNARILKKIGLGEILPQKDLTPTLLYQSINSLISNLQKYKEAGKKAEKLVIFNAERKIIEEIEKIIKVC